ncbi:MAG: UDP-N-acetylmuramoyl-tripeptide--D-alanyl-D-alanine ligase [Treponema sp.]|jgi:UDP-N-acetylmuramoyl-tripeptide--D-alanyl-D-alanine ligase|nr:UDP-N-acetylmuramoyl-tripeptide--D-alanyl-D-alanine ligase [Treponema sp.]
MDNSLLMTFNELSDSLGAELFPGEGGEKGFFSVGIDSRNLKEGSLFVALVGTIQDGHAYAEAAFKAGAAGIMAARSRLEQFNLKALSEKWGRFLVIVEDTLKGLQDAARVYLEKFPHLLKIAITGSSGKTTSKEIIAAMVAQEKNVVMNSGNLNSETGLPLSVFNVCAEHEVGIFEAGMNRKGEISELAEVLKPNIALITNIGSAHIGMIGSKETIAKEKKDIFSKFTGNEKALIPADDMFRDFLCQGVKGKTIFYGAKELFKLREVRDLGLLGTEINWAGKIAHYSLPGSFNLKNAFSAIAIAREIPLCDESIIKGLESVKPLFGRGEIFEGRVTVVRDCYNSNPESMEAAIEFCDSLDWQGDRQGRKIYVIGSMFELGEKSIQAHEDLGRILALSHADMIFLFGVETEIAAAVLALGKVSYFHTNKMDDLIAAIDSYIIPGDLVLLKGSRGCALEQLTPVLTKDKITAQGESK